MTLRAASDNQSPEAFHRKARARRKSACAAVKGGGGRLGTVISAGIATITVRSMFVGAALLALPVEAQEHRFEDDPFVMVRLDFSLPADRGVAPPRWCPRRPARPGMARLGGGRVFWRPAMRP